MKGVSIWVWILGAAALAGLAAAGLGPSPSVQTISNAIAIAERGAGEILSGNVARNNPGDITDSAGNLVSYPTLQDGWNALYAQVARILAGSSPLYPGGAAMTILQLAAVYVDGPNAQGLSAGASNWARNVATVLGVSTDTPLAQITGGG